MKSHTDYRGKSKLILAPDNIMTHMKKLMEWTLKELPELICDFSKVARYKLNVQKSVILLNKSYEWSKILKKECDL